MVVPNLHFVDISRTEISSIGFEWGFKEGDNENTQQECGHQLGRPWGREVAIALFLEFCEKHMGLRKGENHATEKHGFGASVVLCSTQ